jgi:hypothetical protein
MKPALRPVFLLTEKDFRNEFEVISARELVRLRGLRVGHAFVEMGLRTKLLLLKNASPGSIHGKAPDVPV